MDKALLAVMVAVFALGFLAGGATAALGFVFMRIRGGDD